MKSKSGRLKNFCEVCRKQCKDQNGYHCHLNSSSHQNKLRDFVINPNQHIQKYSRQLQWKFVQMLKTKYPGESKNINDVYEQYSQQKYHIQFNSTQWKNLAEFSQYLKGVRNLSVVGEFPNCKVTYLISKTSEFVQQNKKRENQQMKEREKHHAEHSLKSRMEKTKQIEESNYRKAKQQIKRKQAQFQDFDPYKKLEIKIQGMNDTFKRNPLFQVNELEDQQKQQKIIHRNKKIKNADILIERINRQANINNKVNTQEPEQEEVQWITEGIYVKIIPHSISQAFHGKKSKIIKIVEPYVAQLQIGNAKIQIDQSYLETVIPKCGNTVKLLLGDLRDKIGILEKLEIQDGYGIIKVQENLYQISFNGFSKVQ